MRIELRIDRTAPRLWHLRLIERLAQIPEVRVVVSWRNAAESLPSCINFLFVFERLINGLPEGGPASAATEASFSCYTVAFFDEPDLVLDLCGAGEQGSARTWSVTFDGASGEAAALGALLMGRPPAIDVIDTQTSLPVASACPGTETRGIILSAFEDCLARTTTLIVAAVNGAVAPVPREPSKVARARCAAVAKFTMKSLIRIALNRLYRLCCYAPHWRVGWRLVDGPDVVDLLAHPKRGWNNLPDDGLHFYADPFPVVVGDRTYLFVEDFEHRRGRGVISVVEFGDNGPLGSPRSVLATDVHLSYPFVFGHAGEMWMVPECSTGRTINLYRAAKFPAVWELEATLVAGVAASDATLFQEAERWWMMATVRDEGGSFSDALHLWSAISLLGPWVPHRRNPVLIDIAAARPAGRVVRRGGRLIRPVQDCRRGYGAALALAEITRLDDNEFDQKVLATLRSGDLWPGRRIHTLNRAGKLECIDGSAIAIKIKGGISRWTSGLAGHRHDQRANGAPTT